MRVDPRATYLGAGSLLGAAVVVLGLDLGQVLQLGLLVEQQAAHLGQVVPPPLGLLDALSLHPGAALPQGVAATAL